MSGNLCTHGDDGRSNRSATLLQGTRLAGLDGEEEIKMIPQKKERAEARSKGETHGDETRSVIGLHVL